MATTYGSFPGVQVTTAGGGITAVAVGNEEKLAIFGEADYARDGQNVQTDGLSADTADGLDSNNTSASTETAEQPSSRKNAETLFGSDTELADALQEALANGANIDYLYGVAVERYIRQETPSGQTGTLSNVPIYEDTDEIWVDDGGTTLSVEFRHDGAPSTPSDSDTMFINPHTGEYAADTAPGSSFTIDYRSLDYNASFQASGVRNIVNEDETGIYVALSESDAVSSNLQSEVSTLRNNYQLVNGLSPAEPNDNSSESPPDARYDTANYDSANQSVDADYYFKFAPTRLEDVRATVMGGVGGLFAGNPITDPVYNDSLTGYSTLEQSFTKTDADNMRGEDVIPIRQAGSIRVKDNLSTSTETDWERDFWRRRIVDRVILIAKTVGDATIGKINDEQTRAAARRLIEGEIRQLVDDRLIKANTADTQNWFVEVTEDSTNTNEVDINLGITPYGVVKRIDEQVTINT